MMTEQHGWEALIFSGREGVLLDAHVGRVREMTPEEKGKYREWARDHVTLDSERTEIERRDSETAQRLYDETRDTDRRLRWWIGAPNDSVVVPISGEEREAVLRECRETVAERDAEAEHEEDEEARRVEGKYAEAARTGVRQVLETGMDECDDWHEECSCDHITVYAMPDGTQQITRMHTH